MLSIIKSMALNGVDGYIVHVQVDVSNGLPYWEIVGLPDVIVKEAKQRVKIGLKNSKYNISNKRVTVNLAPASKRKGGACFDLAIAMGILRATGSLNDNVNDYVFLGELSLDGNIRKVEGLLSLCLEAKRLNIKNIIIPKENENEAKIVGGLNIYVAKSLKQVVEHLNKINLLEKLKHIKFDVTEKSRYSTDFKDVKGQSYAKRALEIATAGNHNILLIGPPGCGKTMLAKRVQTIMPNLSLDESIEVTKIYSILGKLESEKGMIIDRPFRSPHYTISDSALLGGGENAKPGEASMASYGVLFLDELTEFKKRQIELLRTPLEEGEITISRMNVQNTYISKFMLIGAMNPCNCGWYGVKNKICTCSEVMRKRHIEKISSAIMDRFDLIINMNISNYDEVIYSENVEKSEIIRVRVNKAKQIQQNRYLDESIYSNSELSHEMISIFCKIDEQSRELLKIAYEKLNMSTRVFDKIIKVARTIADIEGCEGIGVQHIAEAIQYRKI